MNEVQLDLIKMSARQMFSDVFVSDAKTDFLQTALFDIHELFVSGKVYGQKSLTEYDIKYPADWLEAVKERFAPAWYLKRHPVKYTRHHITVDAVYPDLSKRLKLPNESHRLILSGYSEDFYKSSNENYPL